MGFCWLANAEGTLCRATLIDKGTKHLDAKKGAYGNPPIHFLQVLFDFAVWRAPTQIWCTMLMQIILFCALSWESLADGCGDFDRHCHKESNLD